MSNTKISDYPDGGAVQAADEFVIARSGANYKIAGSQIGSGTGSALSTATGNITISADTTASGTGDIVLSTDGVVERLRITNAGLAQFGTATGWQNTVANNARLVVRATGYTGQQNDYQFVSQLVVNLFTPTTGNLYEKSAGLFQVLNNVNNPNGLVTGIQSSAIHGQSWINAGVTTGFAQGGVVEALHVDATSEGGLLAWEATVFNDATVQTNVDSALAKINYWGASRGSAAATAFMAMANNTGGWQLGLSLRHVNNTFIRMTHPDTAGVVGIDMQNDANWGEAIRLPNNVALRAYSADGLSRYSLLKVDASNNVVLGSVTAPGGTFIQTVSGSSITMQGDVTVSTHNVISDGTTGTKIGTATSQKFAFWNATPVVQPAGSTDVLASLVTVGLRAASSNPPLNLGSGALTAGASSFSGAVAMGANKITGLAAATANGDAVRYEQIVSLTAGLLTPTAVKTTNYTAAAGDFVPCDTATTGSFTVTLPTAPADFSTVGVKMVKSSGTRTVTVTAGGTDVINVAGVSSLTITLGTDTVVVQYQASSGIWYVLGRGIGPQSLDTIATANATAGSVAMNSNKLTGLSAGTTNGDSVRYEQAMKSGDSVGGDLTGTLPNPSIGNAKVSLAKLAASVTIDALPAPGGDVAMATFKLTGLGAGSAAGHSIRWEQVLQANSFHPLLGALKNFQAFGAGTNQTWTKPGVGTIAIIMVKGAAGGGGGGIASGSNCAGGAGGGTGGWIVCAIPLAALGSTCNVNVATGGAAGTAGNAGGNASGTTAFDSAGGNANITAAGGGAAGTTSASSTGGTAGTATLPTYAGFTISGTATSGTAGGNGTNGAAAGGNGASGSGGAGGGVNTSTARAGGNGSVLNATTSGAGTGGAATGVAGAPSYNLTHIGAPAGINGGAGGGGNTGGSGNNGGAGADGWGGGGGGGGGSCATGGTAGAGGKGDDAWVCVLVY